MPVVNPVMTAVDTNDMTEPSRSRPMISITSPTSTVRVAIAPRLCGDRPAECNTLCDDSAIALVRVVTIRTVRASTDPTIVGTTPDHNPSGAAKPPMLAYAMPSGMEKSPVTKPDTASRTVGRPSSEARPRR